MHVVKYKILIFLLYFSSLKKTYLKKKNIKEKLDYFKYNNTNILHALNTFFVNCKSFLTLFLVEKTYTGTGCLLSNHFMYLFWCTIKYCLKKKNILFWKCGRNTNTIYCRFIQFFFISYTTYFNTNYVINNIYKNSTKKRTIGVWTGREIQILSQCLFY